MKQGLFVTNAPRAFAMLLVLMLTVVVMGIVLSLLDHAAIDARELRRETSDVRAGYAAEGVIVAGAAEVTRRLRADPRARVDDITAPAMPDLRVVSFGVSYVDAESYALRSDPDTASAALSSGPFSGLVTWRTPVQISAEVAVGSGHAHVTDVISVDRVPVFQFGLFADGDLEIDDPRGLRLDSRVHANGDVFFRAPSSSSTLALAEPLTSAGHITRCSKAAPTTCIDDHRVFAYVPSASPAQTVADPSTWSRHALGFGSDHGTDAAQATYLRTRFGEPWPRVADRSTGVESLRVPIPVPTVARLVSTRPQRCASGVSARFAQSPSIEILRRPRGGYTQPYGFHDAVGAHDVDYGPIVADPGDAARCRGVNPAEPPAPLSLAPYARVACQTLAHARSVPAAALRYADDDPLLRDERLYWKAHLRIIDGIWTRGDGTVVFDPEAVDLSVYRTTTHPGFQRWLKLARVLRPSWFWDTRENRVLLTGAPNQRGAQIRATDFDMRAFLEVLDDDSLRRLLFGGVGDIPADGIVVYLSETYDPKHDDVGSVAFGSDVDDVADVRNFLGFSVLDNSATDLAACFPAASPPRRDGSENACARGFHPYLLWGDGAPAAFRSLTPNPGDGAGRDALDDPRMIASGAAVFGVVTASGPAAPSTFSCQERSASNSVDVDKEPCLQAGAVPLGAENAVRLIGARHVPSQGFTLATDNRMYIVGDVNVGRDGLPEVPGRVAVLADSITVLSERFSDRVFQRGGADASDAWNERATLSASNEVATDASILRAWSVEAATASLGAPNLCTPWREALPRPVGVARALQPTNTRIYASLLAGDVPSCPNSSDGDGDRSGGALGLLRLLEDWRGDGTTSVSTGTRTLSVRGSLVSMFRAEAGNARARAPSTAGAAVARGSFHRERSTSPYDIDDGTAASDGTCVYSEPVRDFRLGTAALDPRELPPATPELLWISRLRSVRR